MPPIRRPQTSNIAQDRHEETIRTVDCKTKIDMLVCAETKSLGIEARVHRRLDLATGNNGADQANGDVLLLGPSRDIRLIV